MTLPVGFRGDVLFIERADRGFLSAAAEDGGDKRVLYELRSADIDFYVDLFRLRSGGDPADCLPRAQVASAPAERLRVLIAEDETKMREYVQSVLEAAGCVAITARSGLEAIRAAQEHRPQVLLLDGLLPEMHGFEIARVIRALDPTNYPRIIMMSGIYKSVRYQNEAKLKYQVDGYLTKPVTSSQIADAVFGGPAVNEQTAC